MNYIKIQLHEDKSSQNWFNTNKDSQIFFSDGYYEFAEEFNMYKNNRFADGLFQMGNNGGSYSLNFNKEDLDEILEVIEKTDYEVKYVKSGEYHGTIDITKEEYLNSEVVQTTDGFTEYIMSAM